MRETTHFSPLILFLLAGVGVGLAQRAGTMFAETVTCTNPACPEEVKMSVSTNADEYGVRFECNTKSCATLISNYCLTYVGICSDPYLCSKLGAPMTRQHFEELARTQDAVVASCGRNYHPLMALLKERPLSMRVTHKLPELIGGGK